MSLIRSNTLKIFQSTVFGTGVRILRNFQKKVRYCLVLVTTTIRENHCSKLIHQRHLSGSYEIESGK